ncbi:MAG: spermidine synthase [Sphingomonadales bacterium]|nr:spermidine synthase [Sphingomonadales bacterium]
MAGHVLIGRARVPDGVELQLLQSGDDFLIALGSNELMSTDIYASEEALATLTCARLDRREAPHLLIGGYGMGFTLRAALNAVGQQASITIAEIMPEIIAWARGPMRTLTGGCLDDPRVTLVVDDVGMLIHSADRGYDAILLDVDNGPEGLTRSRNDTLYTPEGLLAAMAALRPRGILAIWSAEEDPTFTGELQRAGFTVEELAVAARPDDEEAHHHIWFARNA